MRIPGTMRLLGVIACSAMLSFAQYGAGGWGRGRVQAGRPAAGFPAGPNLGGRPYPIRQDFAPPTGLIPPAAAYTGISPGGLRTVGGRSQFPIVPIFAPPVYYPTTFGSSFSGYGTPPPVDPNAEALSAAAAAAQDAMAEQIRQLASELERVKANTAQQQALSPEAAVPQRAAPAAPEPQQAPIQVVLRTGEQLSVKSYAVMNGMLWDFSAQRVRKIPISTVDVAASMKATEAGGGEFPQITAP